MVEARDLGIPPNIARGELKLCVTDYNDHAPVFVHPPQNVTIKVPEVCIYSKHLLYNFEILPKTKIS